MVPLPVELIFKILGMAYFDDEILMIPDYKTLSACSLVCSAWTLPAQSLLFHFIQEPMSLTPIIDRKTSRGRLLGGFIRRLDVVIGTIDGALHPERLLALLECCPKVYELIIHIRGLHRLEDPLQLQLQQAINDGIGSNIRALQLLDCGVQSPIIFQILSIWPVQFFTLGTEIVATPPPTPSKLKLCKLVLTRALSTDILDWLLSSSPPTLQILEIRDIPSSDMISSLVKHGPQLRSLRLFSYDSKSDMLAKLCLNLEELVLLHFPPDYSPIYLPPSLRHFQFIKGIDSSRSLRHLISAVQSHDSLRTITCYQNLDMHPNFAALQDACNRKGIEIKFDARRWWIVSVTTALHKISRVNMKVRMTTRSLHNTFQHEVDQYPIFP